MSLLPDGSVFLGTNIFNTVSYAQIPINGVLSKSVLTPNGVISFVNGNVMSLSSNVALTGVFDTPDSILLPNGNVIMIPFTTSNIGMYNGSIYSNIYDTGTSMNWQSGVLAPNGTVILVPWALTANIGIFDPNTFILSNVIQNTVEGSFSSGVLLPCGNIAFTPYNASNVGMFDPKALAYSNSTFVGTDMAKYSSGKLIPSGQVIFTPYMSGTVGIFDTFSPVSREFCLCPYFNKF